MYYYVPPPVLLLAKFTQLLEGSVEEKKKPVRNHSVLRQVRGACDLIKNNKN